MHLMNGDPTLVEPYYEGKVISWFLHKKQKNFFLNFKFKCNLRRYVAVVIHPTVTFIACFESIAVHAVALCEIEYGLHVPFKVGGCTSCESS